METEAILVTTAGTQKGPNRIVVGVDGSTNSKAALRWAAKLAPTLGAHLDVVTAWQFPVFSTMNPDVMSAGLLPAYPELWHPEADAKKVQDLTLMDVFKGAPPPGLTNAVEEGQPASVLLDAAEGATMLVIGSRGHGGFAGLLLGSVSRTCTEHAKCPVLVVHGD